MKKNNIKTKVISFAMAMTAICSVGVMSMTAANASADSTSVCVSASTYRADKFVTWSWANNGDGKGLVKVKNFNANYDYKIVQYGSKNNVLKTDVYTKAMAKKAPAHNFSVHYATCKVVIFSTNPANATAVKTAGTKTTATTTKTTTATTVKTTKPASLGAKYTLDKLVTWSWANPGNGKGLVQVKNFKANYDYVIVQYDSKGVVVRLDYYTHTQAKVAPAHNFKVYNSTSEVEIYSAKIA